MAIARSLFLLLCSSLLSCCSSRTLMKITSHDAFINYYPPSFYSSFAIPPPLPTTLPTAYANPYMPYVSPPGNSFFTPQLPFSPQAPAIPSSTQAPAVVVAAPTKMWCVLRTSSTSTVAQSALDYACGLVPTSCSEINQGGICADQSLLQRVSYVVNSYFTSNPLEPQRCNFNGAATIVNEDPSSGRCQFPSVSPAPPPPIPSPLFYPGNPSSLFGAPAIGATSNPPPPAPPFQGVSSPTLLMTANVPPPGSNPPPTTDFDIFSSKATAAGQPSAAVLVLSGLLLLAAKMSM